MTSSPLHTSLLRPPVLHILRAAGFHTTRPAVLDTLVDLTSRYLILLAEKTAQHATSHPPATTITIADVRLALSAIGALHPQKHAMEEQVLGEEDLRGVDAFVGWCRGDVNARIRFVAGLRADPLNPVPPTTATATTATTNHAVRTPGADIKAAAGPPETTAVADAALGEEPREDFLALLKKKHAKTGEESRFQGTVLGRDRPAEEVRIEGWEVESLSGWGEWLRRGRGAAGAMLGGEEGKGGGGGEEEGGSEDSGSPLTEMSGEI